MTLREFHWCYANGFPPDQGFNREAVHAIFYGLSSLDGLGLFLFCPDSHVFCSFPESRLSCGYGHFLPSPLGAWESWLHQRFLAPNVGRAFLAELREQSVSPAKIPFGLLPFVGGTMNEPDCGYSKRLQQISQLRCRTYLVPRGSRFMNDAVEWMRVLIDERKMFGVRDITLVSEDGRDDQFSPNDVSDPAMIWSFCGVLSDFSGKQRLDKQERAIDLLRREVELAGAGKAAAFDSMSATFLDTSIKFVLPLLAAPTTYHLKDELIASLRIRLARLLEWPVFYPTLRLIPDQYLKRQTEFPMTVQPLPYDIASNLGAYLESVTKRFPSYGLDLFDPIFNGSS